MKFFCAPKMRIFMHNHTFFSQMACYGCHFWVIFYGEIIPIIKNAIQRKKCARTKICIFEFRNEFTRRKQPENVSHHHPFEEKSVDMHENAHKCLKVPSARALFAPSRIFQYGNEFPIKNYLKMTPINRYLKKKCKFHKKMRISA